MEAENPEELKLYNVTEKDEGWYTCIAQNTLGETFSSAYLRVVESEYVTILFEIINYFRIILGNTVFLSEVQMNYIDSVKFTQRWTSREYR